jgi:hypothetical protein
MPGLITINNNNNNKAKLWFLRKCCHFSTTLKNLSPLTLLLFGENFGKLSKKNIVNEC